jgi:putative SOS response-associated peptidase YedK
MGVSKTQQTCYKGNNQLKGINMCYSAMIEADLRTLERRFGAQVDWDNFEEAFDIRSTYPGAMIPSGIDSYLIQSAETPQQKRLAKMAKAHYQEEIDKFSKKLKKFEQDVKDLEIKIKNGSKAKGLEEKLEKRRETVEWHKEKISYYEKIEEQGAPRVFPNFYAPVIIKEKNQHLIRLMRYHLCPKNGKELTPFQYNLFNARKDRLLDSRTWKPIFGKQHAIFPFYRFYESVEGEKGEAKIIYFEPDNKELMWSAAIFEKSQKEEKTLWSFAAITDEPPPEVAATGHDRCPVFIAEDHFQQWLSPEKTSATELLLLLDSRVPTVYKHQAA